MKKSFLSLIFCITALTVSAHETTCRLAPGAMENFRSLLNNPGFVQPTRVTSLERGWFRIESDIHMFTDEVSFEQLAAVLSDRENISRYFQGRRNRAEPTLVQRYGDVLIMDFVATTSVVGLQVRTAYRTTVTNVVNNETAICIELVQLDSDSNTNNSVRNLFISRYAESVSIDGRTYAYIRFVVRNEVNTSIAPVTRNALERNANAAGMEAIQLLITAAKGK